MEYFYDSILPNVHYIPASLHNITDVARYVVDKANEADVRNIVHEANSWCERKMTRDPIINDAMDQVDKYMKAFDRYIEQGKYENELKDFMGTYHSSADSLVECGI